MVSRLYQFVSYCSHSIGYERKLEVMRYTYFSMCVWTTVSS
jgi:hypothetical protein